MDNQLGVLHTRRLRHYWSIIDNIYDTRVRDREDRRKGDPSRDTMHLLTTDFENHLHLSKRERRQVRSACTEPRHGRGPCMTRSVSRVSRGRPSRVYT